MKSGPARCPHCGGRLVHHPLAPLGCEDVEYEPRELSRCEDLASVQLYTLQGSEPEPVELAPGEGGIRCTRCPAKFDRDELVGIYEAALHAQYQQEAHTHEA